MPETLGLKPVGRDGAKRTIALRPRATALHKTSALHPRRCVHSGLRQHGTVPYSAQVALMTQHAPHAAQCPFRGTT